MKTLSPQQEQIVSKLRDYQWHCSSEWPYIKDDRARISNLNRFYMKGKGFEIIGMTCDGRCGKHHSSGLFMRKAVPLTSLAPQRTPVINEPSLADQYKKDAQKACLFFDTYQPTNSTV